MNVVHILLCLADQNGSQPGSSSKLTTTSICNALEELTRKLSIQSQKLDSSVQNTAELKQYLLNLDIDARASSELCDMAPRIPQLENDFSELVDLSAQKFVELEKTLHSELGAMRDGIKALDEQVTTALSHTNEDIKEFCERVLMITSCSAVHPGERSKHALPVQRAIDKRPSDVPRKTTWIDVLAGT